MNRRSLTFADKILIFEFIQFKVELISCISHSDIKEIVRRTCKTRKMNLVAIFTFIALEYAAGANLWPTVEECGKIELDSFYNFTEKTKINEYPWVGRIGYNADGDEKISYRCLAVLISKRYLLSTVHCFQGAQPLHVLLGDWDASNTEVDSDCDDDGDCAPLPEIYEIDDIAVHPDFNRRTKLNDIAVLRLSREVKFSEYIAPICFPPPAVSSSYHVGQFLSFVGFNLYRRDVIKSEFFRRKTLLHVMDTEHCKKSLKNHNVDITDSSFCGTTDRQHPLMSGSAAMGVRLEKGEPHNMYLIGLVIAGTSYGSTTEINLFTRIAPYREWIHNNVVE